MQRTEQPARLEAVPLTHKAAVVDEVMQEALGHALLEVWVRAGSLWDGEVGGDPEGEGCAQGGGQPLPLAPRGLLGVAHALSLL